MGAELATYTLQQVVIENSKIDVTTQIQRLGNFVEACDFAGYDPYDALNSPLLKLLSGKSKWSKILFTQGLKRFPFNVRPILGIQKGHNPKGIGLFLGSYAKLYKAEKKSEYLIKIRYLLSLLDRLKSQGYSGNCWGYNFDWQSKKVFRPKNTPTVVNTAFIGHALLDTYLFTDMQEALDMALGIKDFILKDLNRKNEGSVFCFSYSPVDYDFVHNANVLGASLLIRLYRFTKEDEIKQAALDSLGYCIKYQQESGAWNFAEAKEQQWVDSFHTGFVLESIRHFLILDEATQWRKNYESGVDYYARNFFLEDGTPKYYDNKIHPIDIHAAAEAIFFFSGEGDEYCKLTQAVLRWMMNNMLGGRGHFYFQKSRFITNKICYMRWSQAWAMRALSEYYYNVNKG